MHSSVNDGTNNNERLEFLGDAILDSVVAEYLFNHFPLKDEGFLTEMRSKMVSRAMLKLVAKKIGLEEFIIYNTNDKTLNKSTILGNSLEALIGAVYLDRGYKVVERFIIHRIVKVFMDVSELETLELNFKSRLLEWSQKNDRRIDYLMLEEGEAQNNKFYVMGVKIDGELRGEGKGRNKKTAEQEASKVALEWVKSPEANETAE